MGQCSGKSSVLCFFLFAFLNKVFLRKPGKQVGKKIRDVKRMTPHIELWVRWLLPMEITI